MTDRHHTESATTELDAARESLRLKMQARADRYLASLDVDQAAITVGEAEALGTLLVEAAVRGTPGTTGMSYSELRLHASQLEQEVERLRAYKRNTRKLLRQLNAKVRVLVAGAKLSDMGHAKRSLDELQYELVKSRGRMVVAERRAAQLEAERAPGTLVIDELQETETGIRARGHFAELPPTPGEENGIYDVREGKWDEPAPTNGAGHDKREGGGVMPGEAVPEPSFPAIDLTRVLRDYDEATKAAKTVDEKTGQPDCPDPEKLKLAERVAELEKLLASGVEFVLVTGKQLEPGRYRVIDGKLYREAE